MSKGTKWFIGIVVVVAIAAVALYYYSRKPAPAPPPPAKDGKTPDPVKQVAATPHPAGLNVSLIMSKGTSGPEVQQLQTLLNTLGYKLTVDGQFGPGTAAALDKAKPGTTGITLQQVTAWAADGTLQAAPVDNSGSLIPNLFNAMPGLL